MVTDVAGAGLLRRMVEDAEMYRECQRKHRLLAAAWCK